MSVVATTRDLIQEHGLSLVKQPLRLESFLKDLHPEEDREVFLLCEALFAGFVDRLCREHHVTESTKQTLARDFVSKCGVSIVYASWVIQAWVDILPSVAYRNRTEKKYNGTLDEVLGSLNFTSIG